MKYKSILLLILLLLASLPASAEHSHHMSNGDDANHSTHPMNHSNHATSATPPIEAKPEPIIKEQATVHRNTPTQISTSRPLPKSNELLNSETEYEDIPKEYNTFSKSLKKANTKSKNVKDRMKDYYIDNK